MHIDNFRKNDAVNFKPPKGTVPDEVRDNFNFIRKGKIVWECHYPDNSTLDTLEKWCEDVICITYYWFYFCNITSLSTEINTRYHTKHFTFFIKSCLKNYYHMLDCFSL